MKGHQRGGLEQVACGPFLDAGQMRPQNGCSGRNMPPASARNRRCLACPALTMRFCPKHTLMNINAPDIPCIRDVTEESRTPPHRPRPGQAGVAGASTRAPIAPCCPGECCCAGAQGHPGGWSACHGSAAMKVRPPCGRAGGSHCIGGPEGSGRPGRRRCVTRTGRAKALLWTACRQGPGGGRRCAAGPGGWSRAVPGCHRLLGSVWLHPGLSWLARQGGGRRLSGRRQPGAVQQGGHHSRPPAAGRPPGAAPAMKPAMGGGASCPGFCLFPSGTDTRARHLAVCTCP